MTEKERAKAAEENYKRMRNQLDNLLNADKKLEQIAGKIQSGAVGFNDTAEYSEIVSNYIADVLQENIGDITSPLGKQYCCNALLKDHYTRINDVLGDVQVIVDEKNKIGIAPQKAPFPAKRVERIAHSLEDTTVDEEVIKRRAGAPVANVAKSFHDDYIKKNTDFRSKAGIKCYIVRVSDNKCCEWCNKLAGRYVYGTEPEDIYHRHDNCGCTVTYESDRHRQDIWTKKFWEVSDIPKETYKPKIFSYSEAQKIQNENLHYKGIDKSVKSDIIGLNRKANRRDKNVGAFVSLQIPMQKKAVLQICTKYGIDTTGLTFKIQRSEKMLALPFYGSTDYNNIGRIDLFPNAFIDEEQLLRTVIHEKCHVLQLKKYGKTYTQANLNEMEKKAYRFEELYYYIIKRRV